MTATAQRLPILDRLRQLARQHSQSEIARRTGTPVTSVNRYVQGGKVPAEFFAALVQTMGVNPSWLLIGEGAPSLSEVPKGVGDMAGELLSMVKAMNAVAQMRLGSLAGQEHARMLRELNDALQRYEDLRSRINRRSGPIVAELQQVYGAAINQHDFARTEELRGALTQILRLNDDPAARNEFDAARAHEAFLRRDQETAVTVQRGVYLRALASGGMDDKALEHAHNLCVALGGVGRLHEARRTAAAGLAQAGEPANPSPHWLALNSQLGYFETMLGDLNTGLPRIMRAHSGERVPGGETQKLLVAAIFSGLMDMRRAVSMADAPTAGLLCRLAYLGEDAADLQLVLKKFLGTGPGLIPANMLNAQHAQRVLKALNPRAKSAPATDDEYTDRATQGVRGQFEVAVMFCQLARLENDLKAAKSRLKEADYQLALTPPEISHHLTTLAMHHHNALRLEQREDSAAFFREYKKKGYLLFRRFLD
jgi:hypothetical protein